VVGLLSLVSRHFTGAFAFVPARLLRLSGLARLRKPPSLIGFVLALLLLLQPRYTMIDNDCSRERFILDMKVVELRILCNVIFGVTIIL